MNYTGYDPKDLGLVVKHQAGLHDVLCACPWHGGSDSLCVNLQTGKFICYSCGERGGVAKLVKQTGGRAQWAKFERPSPTEQEREWRKLLDGDLAYDDDYLVSRGVTNDQVEKHGIRSCYGGVAFPLLDRNGNVTGALVRRRVGAIRYLTLGTKPPYWPMNKLDELPPGHGLAVTEGVFGVLSAERAHVEAVAVLGAAVKKELGKWLMPFSLAITFDRDLAGYLGAFKLMSVCPNSRALIDPPEADKLTADEWHALLDDDHERLWTGNRAAILEAATEVCGITYYDFMDKLGHSWSSIKRWPVR